MKRCDACGKRAEGLGTIPTEFNGIVLCSTCYEGLPAFQHGRGYKSIEGLRKKHILAITEMKEKNYPEAVIEAVEAWFCDKEKEQEAKERVQACMADAKSYLMTTAHRFEGYTIKEYHGVITGESVLGTGFMSSWDASISDMLGEESSAFIDKLKQAREYAKKRLIEESIKAGGNAIIAIDIEYTMFTSNMIGVIITGTSVTIEKTVAEGLPQ